MRLTKKPCYETRAIMEYVGMRLQGISAGKHDVPYVHHRDLLEQFVRILDNEASAAGIADQMLVQTTRLSNFDVEMSFMSGKIKNFAGEMTSVSQENMAMVQQVTASMDRVNQSIGAQNGTLNTITEKSKQLISMNNSSIEQLAGINVLKDGVVKDAQETSAKIENLLEMIDKVNEIVEGVENIAGQTNLLALNASIEAARAGQYGLGFAVVADEIRKLADNTRTNLEGMRSFIESINQAATEGKESMVNTLSSTLEISEKIGIVNGSINENVENLQGTVEEIDNLSLAMNGVTAATEEINAAMRHAAEESEKISAMTQEILSQSEISANSAGVIAEIDNEFSKLSGQLNRLLSGGIHSMSNEQLLEHIDMAKAAHSQWLKKLSNMIQKQEIEPIQTNGQKCAFGHFYHQIDVQHPEITNEWKEIDKYHEDLHEQGKYAVEALKNRNIEEARTYYSKAEADSRQIFALMDFVVDKVNGLSRKNIQVFRNAAS